MTEPVPGVTGTDFAIANGARWLMTRYGMDAASARFAAKALAGILYPYAMVAVHGRMADSLREAGLTDVADIVDQVGQRYLTELMQRPEE